MGPASRLAVILALAAGVMAASIPQQLPMRLPLSLPDVTVSRSVGDLCLQASHIYRGEDIYGALQGLTNELDKGLPQDWGKLTQAPTTDGTFAVETIDSLSLDTAIQNWKMDESLLNQVKNDIRTLIEVAAEEAVYVAQHFTYALPRCDAGERPACLTTLLAVVRAKIADDNTLQSAEVAHIYMQSGASTIQQTRPVETCHFCWFRTCCHTRMEDRGLSPEEIQSVRNVLSTFQATWARTQISNGKVPGLSLMNDEDLWPISIIDGLLRQFVQNRHENRDVFKKQESRLLAALQDDMRSHRQNIKKMSVSVNEKGIVPLLENMVADCLNKAGVEEPIADWFKRVRGKNPGQTISLECSVSSQRKETIDPPTDGCRSSTEVTSKTLFSWVVLSPRNTLIDTLIIQSDLDVSHVECEPLPPSEDPGNGHDCVKGTGVAPPEESGGAIVRWSIIHSDGSFNPVHYTKEWLDYPYLVNKAMLDILRYSAATAYLRVPIPPSMHQLQDYESYYIGEGNGQQIPSTGEYDTAMFDPASLAALASAMKQFAEGWTAIAKALGSSVKEDIKIKLCLGFEKYYHQSKAFSASGIDPSNLLEFVGEVINTSQLPDNNDLKSIMLGVKYSDTEFTWTGESMAYTAPDGKNHFLYLTKHANPETNKVDLIYGMVNSQYELAKDMLVVHRTESILGGLFSSEKTTFNYIPHVLSINDTMVLQMYFEMVVFRRMAMTAGLPVPKFPDLSALCDRSP
ncbi:hypothetical protein BGX31_001333 [Mortierella sp. GBA43]|nr:hypothetical protein BGX31_001333 [Mortierella sp. GBA43]